MNKQAERQALLSVFGPQCFESIVDCEEPDFICTASDGTICGVEVTEFYPTDSDARLRNIPAYGLNLLEGGAYRHKHDKKELRVEEVVYTQGHSSDGRKIKAIARPVLTQWGAICRVFDSVRSKEAKLANYVDKANEVNLIIIDVQGSTRFRAVSDLMELIWDEKQLTTISQSGFQEIYLVTQHEMNRNVCVPLRANVFMAEILTFQRAYRKYLKLKHARSTVGQFVSILSSYLFSVLSGVRSKVVENSPSFLCANTIACFESDGKWSFSETFSDCSGWTQLADCIDPLDQAIVSEIRESITDEFVCVDFYFNRK